MNRRLIVPLTILLGGPLVVALVWPWLADKLKTAELSLALVTLPREEIAASGSFHDDEVPAFGLMSLSIEEPGKEPYRRPISLDAQRSFELALGPPRPGTYRIALRTRETAGSANGEHWLQAPDLLVPTGRPLTPQKVSSREFSYPGLLLVGCVTLVAQAALLVAWFRLIAGVRKPPVTSELAAADRTAAA